MHPYFGLHFEKKNNISRKQRKWLCKTSVKNHIFNTIKKMCMMIFLEMSLSAPAIDETILVFRWILLAVNHCHHGYHLPSTPCSTSFIQGILSVSELRSINEELQLNWCFLSQILLSHFQSHELQRCYNQAGLYICMWRTPTSRSLFSQFHSHYVVLVNALLLGSLFKEDV